MNSHGGNPFRMPTDEEVFILRDEEKRQNTMERERLKGQPVHEKTTQSARIGAARSQITDEDMDDSRNQSQHQNLHSEVHLPTIDVREKDNMAVYIQKKREMGLARMSLATKRQEIKKLDEEADRSEKRLKQQQDQLASTHEKFNNFLKHSNLEQDAAVKRADIETKAKQEKLLEIKKLSAQIAQLEADKKKNEEQMEQCLGFKKFLDDLTKPSWFVDTLFALRVEDERQRIVLELENAFAEDVDNLEQDEQERRQEEMLSILESRVTSTASALRQQVEGLLLPDIKDNLDAYDPDRVPMFFTEPNQILEQFINIEEGNLFLIQNCQELEEEIENIAQLYQQEQQEMQSIAGQRKQQMEGVTNKIHIEQTKMRTLLERLERVLGSGDPSQSKESKDDKKDEKKGPGEKKDPAAETRQLTQEELKVKIEEKVKAIFRTLNNLGGDETNMDSLGMLTYIETKLEEMRQTIKNPKNGIDETFVAATMKQRDKDRRRQARQVMLNKQAEEREERSRKALERSQAPVIKRVGKPVMWRSRPIDTKKKETVVKQETTGEEDDEFFM
ncbi:unnamed protein product [Bodo saltans]|uniref:DUF4200 domain-containing protein n=1 Tax=Bodo saltans TaxID=75058 RepID=A0A0S4JTR7_BODSA|nr:unnamed protein product [Bodo saltans]|eukprot:CUG94218.1 unnamed protein product [Bodo saltans]